jgi:hypothetical protein
VNLDYAFFLAHLEQYQLLLCSSERPTAVFRIIAYRRRRKKPGLATGLFFTLNFKGALGAPSRR